MADLRWLSSGGADALASGSYHDAAVAMCLLSTEELASHVNTAAHDDPAFLDDLIAAAELFRRLDPPPGLAPERSRALANAIYVMYRVSQPSTHSPPRVLAFKDTLRCLGLAASAGIHVFQGGDGEDDCQLVQVSQDLSFLLLSIIEHSLLPDCIAPPGTEASSWAAHYQALETLLRLAALVLARGPGGPEDPISTGVSLADALFARVHILFTALSTHHPTEAAPEEPEAWNSATGLVGSALKLAVCAAGPEAGTPSQTNMGCVRTMVAAAALSIESMKGKEEEAGFPARQVCGEVAILVSLARRQCPNFVGFLHTSVQAVAGPGAVNMGGGV